MPSTTTDRQSGVSTGVPTPEDRRRGVNSGIAIKIPCRVATTANITLSGEQTIDGVAAVAGDRVLVKDQTTQTENGIYAVDTGTWERAVDFDGAYNIVNGTLVKVNSGTAGQGFWYVSTADPITIGTSNITFGRASTVLAVVSAFVQTLLDDADASTFLSTLGVTAFIKTLLDDVDAAAARSTLGVLSSAEVVLQALADAAGDTIVATEADTFAKFPATATAAAHATTMDPWVAQYFVPSGGPVTFTGLAAARYAGQEVEIYMNAAHTFTDGAVFEIDGDANWTAEAGDRAILRAKTTTAFLLKPIKKTGVPASMAPITASLGADVTLNNIGLYFDGPSIAQGTAGVWFVSGTVSVYDSTGASAFFAKLWDGTTVIASAYATTQGANTREAISLSGFISAPAGNIRISVNDPTNATGVIAYNGTALGKDATITAIRIA